MPKSPPEITCAGDPPPFWQTLWRHLDHSTCAGRFGQIKFHLFIVVIVEGKQLESGWNFCTIKPYTEMVKKLLPLSSSEARHGTVESHPGTGSSGPAVDGPDHDPDA